MKNLLSATLLLILGSASLSASQVVVFEGSYRNFPARDANLSRSERHQRCFLVVDIAPGRPAVSEVLMSVLTYGAPDGIKQQRLLSFGVLPWLIVENGIPALALNRLDGGGSVIMGYANRTSTFFAFQTDSVRLKGDYSKSMPENQVSTLELPRALSGVLMKLVVDDSGVFPPGIIATSKYNEATVFVSQNKTFTTEFRNEGLTVFQAIERLSAFLETKGYGSLPK